MMFNELSDQSGLNKKRESILSSKGFAVMQRMFCYKSTRVILLMEPVDELNPSRDSKGHHKHSEIQ